MITTDLKSVSKLPLHTRIETAVGLAFDVMNGKKNNVQIKGDLTPIDLGEFKVFSARLADSASSARAVVESYFQTYPELQRGKLGLRMVSSRKGSVDIYLMAEIK